MAYDNPRGAADTLGTTYLAAGSYPVSLVYFQGGGGGDGVLCRQGEQFRGGDLLRRELDSRGSDYGHHRQRRHQHHNDPSGGHQHAVQRDHQQQRAVCGRRGHERQVDGRRRPLPRPAPPRCTRASRSTPRIYASLSSLTLKMQYDDGYVAYLNGVEIASENAPSFAHLELAGQRGADQRRPGHHLRERRHFEFPQFGHHRPPHGHRQRAGHPGPDVLAHGRGHAGRAGTGPDDERRGGRPHFLHAHAGRRQRRWATCRPASPSARRTGYSTPPSS